MLASPNVPLPSSRHARRCGAGAAHPIREPNVRRVPDRQVHARAGRERPRAAPGAHHDAPVLDHAPARAQLDRAVAGRADRHDLVGNERGAERAGQRGDRRPRPDHAGVLVEQHVAGHVGQEGQPLGALGRVDEACANAARAQEGEPVGHAGTECEHAVGPQQLDPEALLPRTPQRQGLAGEGDEPGIVVQVAEDPRLAAGLPAAGLVRVVDGHGGARGGERVRGRETDDARADDRDLRALLHAARLPAIHAAQTAAAAGSTVGPAVRVKSRMVGPPGHCAAVGRRHTAQVAPAAMTSRA